MSRVDEGKQIQTANKSNQPPSSKKKKIKKKWRVRRAERDFIITAQIDPTEPKVLRAALC